MIRNQNSEFQKFSQVPLEGQIRFWKEDGIHREPNNSSYQHSLKLNNHHIVFAEPDGYDTVVACVNCNRGIEVEEVTGLVKRYILGYFYENACR